MNLFGIVKLKLSFLNLFLPSGTPFFISPFVIIIELISYVARLFSLSIRLFANIMAGHTLIKILVFFA
jgi:F0F1-type ATP synthase membrane subunit a